MPGRPIYGPDFARVEIAPGLAINGRLSPLHERMHHADRAGGWP